jgi:hypothetical protein
MGALLSKSPNGSAADFLVLDFFTGGKCREEDKGGEEVFSDEGVLEVASNEARWVGAGGSGINQGLDRRLEFVVTKKKPP